MDDQTMAIPKNVIKKQHNNLSYAKRIPEMSEIKDSVISDG
jgi:hypothetical protein